MSLVISLVRIYNCLRLSVCSSPRTAQLGSSALYLLDNCVATLATLPLWPVGLCTPAYGLLHHQLRAHLVDKACICFPCNLAGMSVLHLRHLALEHGAASENRPYDITPSLWRLSLSSSSHIGGGLGLDVCWRFTWDPLATSGANLTVASTNIPWEAGACLAALTSRLCKHLYCFRHLPRASSLPCSAPTALAAQSTASQALSSVAVLPKPAVVEALAPTLHRHPFLPSFICRTSHRRQVQMCESHRPLLDLILL